jgi:hypothetical protein
MSLRPVTNPKTWSSLFSVLHEIIPLNRMSLGPVTNPKAGPHYLVFFTK